MTSPPGPYPPPDGEPIYVPEPPPAQSPYPQLYGQPYGQPFSQPFSQPYAYAPPVFSPYSTPPPRRSEPAMGWLLFLVGVLVAVASLLPWAVFFGVSVDGTKGDGTLTVLCAVVISAAGLIIGLGQGLLWAPVTACVCAVLVTVTAAVDISDVSRLVSVTDTFSPDAVTVGPGLWLTLVGGLLGIAVAVVAMVRRPVAG